FRGKLRTRHCASHCLAVTAQRRSGKRGTVSPIFATPHQRLVRARTHGQLKDRRRAVILCSEANRLSIRRPRELGHPTVEVGRRRARLALPRAGCIGRDNHKFPAVGLEPRTTLRSVGHLIARLREYWPTVRRLVLICQTLPCLGSAGNRHSADVVVRAPCFVL